MARFVVRFTGPGAAPKADQDRIRATPGVEIIDESPRMLLVQADPPVANDLAGQLKNWVVAPEQIIPLPDPHPRLRSS